MSVLFSLCIFLTDLIYCIYDHNFIYSKIFILVTLPGDLQVISYLGVILYCIVIKEIREAPKLTEIACIKFWKTIVKTIYMAI
jgi:hypothetical protein